MSVCRAKWARSVRRAAFLPVELRHIRSRVAGPRQRGRRSATACPDSEHADGTAGALTREHEVPCSRTAPKGRKAQQLKRLKAGQRGNASGTLPCEPARLRDKCANGVLSRSMPLTTAELTFVKLVLSESDPRALGRVLC
ncbi:hypothetical protein ERJ75_001174800 [Trypanosoma vivax]|nr:hypothetical protein ERJ75_001174800 [Trypanosoma vivax]